MTLETGDILLLTQPYDHPNLTELKRIERLGGYVVQPRSAMGLSSHHVPPRRLPPPPRQISKHIKPKKPPFAFVARFKPTESLALIKQFI